MGFADGQALVTRFSGAGVELMPSHSTARTSACSQAPRRSGTRLCPSGGPYLQREVRSRSVWNSVFIYSFFLVSDSWGFWQQRQSFRYPVSTWTWVFWDTELVWSSVWHGQAWHSGSAAAALNAAQSLCCLNRPHEFCYL